MRLLSDYHTATATKSQRLFVFIHDLNRIGKEY